MTNKAIKYFRDLIRKPKLRTSQKIKKNNRQKLCVLTLCLLISGTFLPLACQKKTSNTNKEKIAAGDKTKKDKKDLEVIAYSKEHTVYLSDYKRCVAMHTFEGHAMSVRALANPRFQRDEARRCYQIQYLREFAKKHGLDVNEEERQEKIKKVLLRDHLPNQTALAKHLKLSEDDLKILVDDEIIPKIIQKHLANQIDEDKAKKLYQRDFRRFELEIACFENKPEEEEIQDVLTTKLETVENYFSLSPWRFVEPPKAHFTRYAFKNTGTDIEQALIRQNALQLRQIAIQKGEEEATKYCVEQAKNGCHVLNDGDEPYVIERNEKNAWAFKIAVGYVPEIILSQEQDEIWLLTNIIAPEPADISEPKVQEKVARKMLSESKASEKIIKGLKNFFQTHEDDLALAAETFKGQYQNFENIYAIDLERVSKTLPNALLEALAEIKDEEINLISNPILAKEQIYIFRVKSLETPQSSSYIQNRELWLERVAEDPKLNLVKKMIEEDMPPISSLNIRGIQIQYGVLQPNGRIQ